jgi:hypothetical protein
MNFFHIFTFVFLAQFLLNYQTYGQCAAGVTTLVKVTSSSGAGTYESPALGNIEFEFCFNLDEFFEAQTNWVHGIFISFGDLQEGVVYEVGSTGEQNTQFGNRKWIYIDSLKARQYNLPGIGFYVDDLDGNPRNNYGDNGKGTPKAKFPDLKPFCMKARYTCGYPRILRPTITVTGDGTSGGWNNPACPGDKFVASFGGPNNNGYIVVCGALLPLDLLSFSGSFSNGFNHLLWTGVADDLFSHYELERKYQSEKEYKTIAQFYLDASIDNNLNHSFYYSDPDIPNSISYYRLKMVERNQSYLYSKVISIRPDAKESIKMDLMIYPQPATQILTISSAHDLRDLEYRIYDQTGRQVKTGGFTRAEQFENSYQCDVSKLNPGIYFIRITRSASLLEFGLSAPEHITLKFIKN